MDTQDTHTTHTHAHNTKSKKLEISTGTGIVTAGFIIAIAIFASGMMKKSDTQYGALKDTTAPQAPIVVPKEIATVRDTDLVFGNKNASVVIFEYADTDCYYCQKFHSTVQSVVKKYDGKVAWVYRLFPLTSLHPNAATEATALVCVGKLGGTDAYWSYLDTIINITLDPDPKANEQLFTIAEGLGVKKADLKTCMADPSIENAIQATSTEISSIGARGTPFSVAVNVKTGKQKVIAGAYSEADVSAMINELLK